LVTGGHGPRNITVTNNYTYHSPSTQGRGSALGWAVDVGASDLVATDNYWIGGPIAIEMFHWSGLTYMRNTAYSDQHLVVAADLGRGNFQWTQNKYYGGGDFSLEGKGLTFTDWRSTTKLDSDSRSSTTRPTVNWVFIRPNRYEPGRANITIYNWELAPLVSVDVSRILTTGQRFEVRNARDFFGEPVLAGTYHGGAVSIPMTKLSGTEPYGTGVKSQKEGAREFGAFVLLSKRSISKATSP